MSNSDADKNAVITAVSLEGKARSSREKVVVLHDIPVDRHK